MRSTMCLASLLALTTAVAHADTREHQQAELQRFQRYAGAPVEQFTMFDMWKWQGLGPEWVAVWTTVNDAYLIRVEKSCNNLDWTHGLTLTQKMRQQVTQKFDYVAFDGQRCKIEEIRPIDYRAMIKAGENAPAHE